jgi:hypothetical protein
MSETLRSFRRNAVHIRQALDLFQTEVGRVGMAGGYLQDEGLVERYKRLSIPVRRALNPTDRASFAEARAELGVAGAPPEALARIDEAWRQLQQELDSLVTLGGNRAPRRQVLSAWLEGAAFYDKLDRHRAYDELIDQYGKAAEGMGAELTEQASRVILLLDEAAAAALGEPVILPPPPKTPPPPPDPKDSLWKRLFGGWGRSTT